MLLRINFYLTYIFSYYWKLVKISCWQKQVFFKKIVSDLKRSVTMNYDFVLAQPSTSYELNFTQVLVKPWYGFQVLSEWKTRNNLPDKSTIVRFEPLASWSESKYVYHLLRNKQYHTMFLKPFPTRVTLNWYLSVHTSELQ